MTDESTIRARELAQQIRATTIGVLKDHLNDRSSIEWALELNDNHVEEQNAIRELLTFPELKVKEPFRSAWFWLLESWSARPRTHNDSLSSLSQSRIQHSIKSRGINGEVLRQVVDLVRPWPRLKKLEGWRLYGGPPPPKVPRKLDDLVSISMSGGDLIALKDVGLQDLADTALAGELADRLEAALIDGLHVARRLGWIGGGRDQTNYDVRRVYRIGRTGRVDVNDPDPDTYRHGFAPVTKLLYEVIDLLRRIDTKNALVRIGDWRDSEWAIFRRLWAALARSREFISADDLPGFFANLTDQQFWNHFEHPEIAELRARRFNDLSEAGKLAIEERIRALPPGSLWWRKLSAKQLVRFRNVRAAIELRRILAAGGHISDASRSWLGDVATKYEVPAVDAIDFDFEPAVLADWMSDDLETFAEADVRTALDKIESTLSANSSWSDDNARAARSYIGTHLSDFLELFSASPDLSEKSPRVWQEILRLQRQSAEAAGAAADEVEAASREAAKVLRLLNSLPDDVLAMMADGLSDWMASWVESLKTDPLFAALWLRAWRAAVAATNQRAPPEEPEEEDISGLLDDSEPDQGERLATAALNTPVGHMMTAFLGMWPRSLKDAPHPFASDPLRRMRDAATGAEGQARLQVLYRFLSHLEYMRHADQEWTDRNLLNPLNNAGTTEIEIWDAIARNRVLGYGTMLLIGQRMAEVAHSGALPANTRARLGERVVLRVLLDKNEGKDDPSVPDKVVQQMLRLGTDQLRAMSGRIVGVFVESEDGKTSREERFRNVVGPFLEFVWPKERTLLSRSLSNAFAEVPSKCGSAFAEAVEVLERFLTPFDCWSLHEYGLYDRDPDGKKIRKLNGPREAVALLKLLDITIGSEERAVHPLDLDRALVVIRDADPKLVRDTRYARLSTLVRR